MTIKPGTDVFIYGVFYEKDTGELEVYPRDLDHWWGIPMTEDEANKVIAKLDETGVFFYKDVRHVVV